MSNATCSIDGCTDVPLARTWCNKHYKRWRKFGDPSADTRAELRAKSELEDGRFVCSSCGAAKEPEEFHFRRDRGARACHCKACHSDLASAWWAENAENTIGARKAWRAENRELALARARQYTNKRRAMLMSAEYDSAVTIEALMERDGAFCAYYGKPVAVDAEISSKASIDHVLPVSLGGPHTFDNTVVACRPCNSSKHARTPKEWERVLKRRAALLGATAP